MNQEIIKKLIAHGILPTCDILEKVKSEGIDSVIYPHQESKILINKREIKKRKKLTPQDFFQYYTNKFEGIKSLLLKKMNAISINKAKTSFLPVSVIGMVQEIIPNGFILEDPTGRIEVISQEPEINPDDVLGVSGLVREGKLFAQKIIWPDVPLPDQTKSLPITLTLSLQNTKTPYTITPETNPFWCEITNGKTKIILLAYKPKNPINKQQAFTLLKKRHLSPERNQIMFTEDYFLINPVPEIFWIVSDETWFSRYKGVTIVSAMSSKIDLKTMEVQIL